MSNVVVNGDFESGTSPWLFTYSAHRDASAGYGGSACASVTWDTGHPDIGITAYQESLSLVPGRTYDVTCLVKSIATQGTLTVQIDKGGGSYETLATRADLLGSFTSWAVGSFVAAGDTGKIRFSVSGVAGVGSGWLVDNVSVAASSGAKRRQIKEAIITALGNISVANGYLTNVVEVVGERKQFRDLANFPAMFVVYVREDKETSAYHMKECECDFMVGCVAKGEYADDTCDDMSADVEQCLEAVDGNNDHLGLGFVRDVRVLSVDATEPTEEKHRDRRVWLCTVRVTYTYTRLDP